MQLALDLPVPADALMWRRYPGVARAHHQMLIGGKPNGAAVLACGHQTALRPYYVVLPNGETLERKFSRLAEAKAAAIEALKKYRQGIATLEAED